jgi:hypothetical protein
LEHVREHDCPPPPFPSVGGAVIGQRLLIERRGVDLERSADERLVCEAIRRARRTQAGTDLLVERM